MGKVSNDDLAVVIGMRFAGELFRLESRARTAKLNGGEARDLDRLRKINQVLDKAIGAAPKPFHANKDSPL